MIEFDIPIKTYPKEGRLDSNIATNNFHWVTLSWRFLDLYHFYKENSAINSPENPATLLMPRFPYAIYPCWCEALTDACRVSFQKKFALLLNRKKFTIIDLCFSFNCIRFLNISAYCSLSSVISILFF